MLKKSLRKKFFQVRKKKYFEVKSNFFDPILKLLKKKFHDKNKIYMSLYYPSNFEVNVLKIFEILDFKKIVTLIPVLNKSSMKFHKWRSFEVLKVNKFGMLEPLNDKKIFIPHIMLIPLLSFDSLNNRLGYGGGFYDKYLNKCIKKNKNIITIGIAFSFQKYNKLPVSHSDVKLNYILTERGLR